MKSLLQDAIKSTRQKLMLFLVLCLYCLPYAINADTQQTSLVRVTTKPLSELLISTKNSVPATVVSLNHAVLGAQISGRVTSIKVRIGDEVDKGVVLLKMDCSDYVLAEKQVIAGLESAKAQAALAAKQYTRNLQLRKIKSIPQNLLDESILQTQVSRAEIAVKKASLKQARLAVDRCEIKAPFTGQITERLASIGQLLAPNMPVFKLLETQALEVQAELTPSAIVNAKKANKLSFIYGSLAIPVQIRSVVKEIQAASRTQRIRLLPKRVNDLVVGYSGRLEWHSQRSMLPADYLLRRNNALGVMLLDHSKPKTPKASFHPLPDASEGQPALIDLPANTQVIVTNRFRLKNDERVEWLTSSSQSLDKSQS